MEAPGHPLILNNISKELETKYNIICLACGYRRIFHQTQEDKRICCPHYYGKDLTYYSAVGTYTSSNYASTGSAIS